MKIHDHEKRHMLRVLEHHIGEDEGIGVIRLAARLKNTERRCRHIISDLRESGYAVCGTPTTGYYMAATANDLNRCCDFLRCRAMHSLHLEARLRKMALPDLIEQLRFTEV